MRRDIFQAIADPIRRALILLVAFRAMTPNALAEHFDTSRQAVSKHLRILTECQIVKQEQVGREIYYQLTQRKWKKLPNGSTSLKGFGPAALMNLTTYYPH